MTNGLNRRDLFRSAGALAFLGGIGLGPHAALAASTTLRAAITGYNVINTLDPGKATLIPEFYVIWGVYNGLLKFDDNMKIVPDLAESYGHAEDGSLEFKLRAGVKFHDGTEMTSEDVKFSLERVMDEAFGSPNRSKVVEIERIEAVDPLTVRIYMKRPFAPLLTFLTNARTGTQIVSKKAVEAAGEEAFGRAPVGTGPFKLAGWDAGTGLKLVAHADYFEGPSSITDVEIPLISEEASGVTALKGGQIDMTSTVPPADVPTLLQDKSVTLLREPGLNTRFFSINLNKAPFDDIHFRTAVSMAFQREAMVAAVLFGEGKVASGIIPPGLGDYFSGETYPETTFDPAAAKAEMAKSKYKPDEIAVPVITWGGGFWKRMAEVFVAQVNQTLGTKFTVEVTDSNAAYARQQSGDFLCSAWGWLGMVDPDEYVGDILASKGWRNFGKYSNAEVDELASAGAAELDPSKRADIYRKAEAIAMKEVAVIPCFFSNIGNLLSANVTGFHQKPYSNFADQFHSMKKV